MKPSLKRKLILSLFILLSSFFAVAVVQAQGGTPGNPTDDDVNRVAKNLYCPVCPNTPLDVCETKACEDWRAQIHEQLAQGWTDQQVLDFFVAQYGERVLAEPQRKGFTSLVWFLPVIAALLGLWMVFEVLRGWRKQKQMPEVIQTHIEDIPQDVLDRIELELREMK